MLGCAENMPDVCNLLRNAPFSFSRQRNFVVNNLVTLASCVLVAASLLVGGADASAAVVASASMTVSATVAPTCAEHGCTTSGIRTEHLVSIDTNAASNLVNPAPAAPSVRQMLVINY